MNQHVRISYDRACMCVPQLREGKGSFRLFTEGDDLYEAMLAAISDAQRAIRLESFIFAPDEVGWRFVTTLAAQARTGLDVRLHLDSQGSNFWRFRHLQRELVQAGVQLKWFHPWNWRHP